MPSTAKQTPHTFARGLGSLQSVLKQMEAGDYLLAAPFIPNVFSFEPLFKVSETLRYWMVAAAAVYVNEQQEQYVMLIAHG